MTRKTTDQNEPDNKSETKKKTTRTRKKPTAETKPKKAAPKSKEMTPDEAAQIDPSTIQQTTSASSGQDPDVTALHALNEQDQMWYFLDDLVPNDKTDTEVLISTSGMCDSGLGNFMITPNSIEIFEQIANMPHHVSQRYPEMVKFFPDIIRLYKDLYQEDMNPYWDIQPLANISMSMIPYFTEVMQHKLKAYLTRKTNQGIPYRLIYGDDSHKHDYVGVVYLTFK